MMVWLNGEWKEEGEAAVAADDGAFLRGEGVFETMLALGGTVFELARHWKRLVAGGQRFGMAAADAEWAREICEELLARNQLTDPCQRVRMRVTLSPQSCLFTAQVSDQPPEKIRLAKTDFRRNSQSPLSGIKAISYAENVLALKEGRQRGADEVLFFNEKEQWCEGAWSNIFAVAKGRLLTPPLSSGCLPGVTRELVIELAREAAIEVCEEVLSMVRLSEVEELFLSSSLLGIGAVSHFDGRELEQGPLTTQLAELLAAREQKIQAR